MSRLFTVKMPDIGEGVVEGEVIEWLKREGDPLSQDEPVVTLMTDKATVELPAPYPGKLAKQYYAVGQMAQYDLPLYDIALAEGVECASIEEKKEERVSEKAYTIPVEEATDVVMRASGQKALATPPVRHLAKQLGIDINAVGGSGKEGRVTRKDLTRAVAQEEGTSLLHLEDDTEEPILGVRGLMAKKMAESKQKAAHFSYFEAADATRLVALRKKVKEEATQQGVAVTYMPFLIRALSLALQEYPTFNSCVDSERARLIIHRQHNIGIAMTTPLGLIVPVLKGVQYMKLEEIIRAYHALKTRAQEGKLSKSDMKEATITISNFGVLSGGGLWATPVINYPEVAILGVARIQKQPVVKQNEIIARDTLNLSWSFDHRVIDGDMAATFSHHYAQLIQNPAVLT